MARLSKLISFASPHYLKSKVSDNYTFLLKKVLKLDNPKVNNIDMSILFIESGLYSVMTWAFKSTIGVSKEVFTDDIHTWINSLVATGRSAWKLVKNWEAKTIKPVQSSNLFSSYIDWVEVFTEITLYKKTNDVYALTRTFYTGYNEVKLYKCSTFSIHDGKEVALTAIDETATLSEREDTGLTMPAIFVSTDSDRIFESSQSLVDSVDRKLTSIEVEFHKYLQAEKIYKNIKFPQTAIDQETWVIVKEKIGDIFISNDDNADILYRFNSNPMIDKAEESIRNDIMRISAISHIPVEYFGIETTDGAIGSESRAQKNAIYFSKVTSFREFISEAYNMLTGQTLTFWPIIGYDTNTLNAWTGTTQGGN